VPDPAALDARAASLRTLAGDVDDCADLAITRAGSPHWSSPNADDVRDRLRQARSRAHTAADALRDEAARAAQHERDRRDRERRDKERREHERLQDQAR
jgi:hypothetical protein